MEVGDIFFGRRIRQNHAIEHATVTVLTRRQPHLRLSARSTSRGYIIFADLDPNLVRDAMDEAMARLRAGDVDLAIHPNCGTNLAVGTSLAMVGVLCAFSAARPRTRVATVAAGSLAGLVAARPLGTIVQRHVTTLPDVADVRVVDVRRRQRLGMTVVEVRTRAV
ncbi:MAG TPA: DUF6391 domain-containing protein [Ktedonobacterales bacterium]|nr:DUF6391 domain-containing protein [Ktedonobacterales bacterium]